jgi:hypothetical protein
MISPDLIDFLLRCSLPLYHAKMVLRRCNLPEIQPSSTNCNLDLTSEATAIVKALSLGLAEGKTTRSHQRSAAP